MAETKQIAFNLNEVTACLIKQQGIHEGSWLLGFEFGFGAGNFGNSPDDAKPGAIVQINQVLLIRHEAIHPTGLAVDAAEVNPAPAAQVATKDKKSTKPGSKS